MCVHNAALRLPGTGERLHEIKGGWRFLLPGRDADSGASGLALRRLTSRFAIALRLFSAFAFAIAGPLAATGPVSAPLLATVLAVLCGWSLIFGWLVWRRGLIAPVVLADAAVIVALLSAHQRVVPAAVIAAGTTWMLPLASTVVFIAQLAFPPAAGVPLGLTVTVAYVVTVPRPADAPFLVLQTILTAALMALVRGGGRSADALLAQRLLTEQALLADQARRADQREQFRQLHDTILATLTIAGSGTFSGPSPVLAAQAARDLRVLRTLRAAPGTAAAAAASLAGALRQAAAAAAPLRVRVTAAPADSVPAAVAERFAECAGEALRNVRQHAGVPEAEVRARHEGGQHVVEVIDRGLGFDPRAVPRVRRGIRESICGRMAAAGGVASVSSQPGAGTTVTLRWPA